MKFEKKVCFIKDENYHNIRSRSPYVYIISIENLTKSTGVDLYKIELMDVRGRIYTINQSKHWVYNKLEILPINKISHLLKDFVRFLFMEQR